MPKPIMVDNPTINTATAIFLLMLSSGFLPILFPL
jgi:hypothetical protein